MNPDLGTVMPISTSVPDGDLLNAQGGVNDTSTWKWHAFQIPPLPGSGFRIRLRATFATENGFFGLDNVKVFTDQQCQPRWVLALQNISKQVSE